MARKLFEFRATRARAGGLASGIEYIVWDDEAATVLADISTTSGGSSIAGSTVTTADIAGLGPSACRFYGPTDDQDTLWVTCPSDPTLGVQRVEASTDARLDALEAGGGGPFSWLEIDPTAAPYNVVVGAANSSAGMQAAVDASEGTGKAIRLPSGTINCNIQVGDNVTMRGAGRMKTVLKSVAGSNIDVVKGKNFATLTNTDPAAPETAGDNSLHLYDLCIDGNSDNNTQGYGIRIWGVGHVWHNIIVRNCSQDGIHSEFSQEVDTFSGDWGVLEGDFSGIETIHNDGNGWTFLGPHDSWLNNYVTYGNGGWGLETRTHATNYDGVIHGTNWNSFLNTSGSFKLGSSFNLGFVIASGTSGVGVDIQPGMANCSIRQLYAGGHPTGMILRGSGHNIRGVFDNCPTVAIEINVAVLCILDIVVDNTPKVFTVTSDQGYHHIRARIHLTGGQVVKTGTFQTASAIDVRDSGNVEHFFQHPVALFTGQIAKVGLGLAATATSQLVVQSTADADTILVVKARASQSGNSFEVRDSTDAAVVKVDHGGNFQASTFQPIATPGTGAYFAFNSNIAQVVQRSSGATALLVNGASGQTGDLLALMVAGTPVAGVNAAGQLKFVAANEATTVGAAGGASALPATPTGYFLVKDSGDVTRKVPYYAT